jgi:hypothetical protein
MLRVIRGPVKGGLEQVHPYRLSGSSPATRLRDWKRHAWPVGGGDGVEASDVGSP